MSDAKSGASLIIFSTENDLGFISDCLERQPSRIVRNKGKFGDVENPPHSKWILKSELAETCSLAEHIEAMVRVLEEHANAITSVSDKILNTTIFCLFSSPDGQGSAEINAALLERLARQKVDLVIDLYPPNGIK